MKLHAWCLTWTPRSRGSCFTRWLTGWMKSAARAVQSARKPTHTHQTSPHSDPLSTALWWPVRSRTAKKLIQFQQRMTPAHAPTHGSGWMRPYVHALLCTWEGKAQLWMAWIQCWIIGIQPVTVTSRLYKLSLCGSVHSNILMKPAKYVAEYGAFRLNLLWFSSLMGKRMYTLLYLSAFTSFYCTKPHNQSHTVII